MVCTIGGNAMLAELKCINCHTPYDQAALYCTKCGVILPHALEGGLEATRSVTDLQAQGADLQWGTSYFHHRARLFFNVQESDAVLPIRLEKGQAVIGRGGTLPVDVDLTPFGAVDL